MAPRLLHARATSIIGIPRRPRALSYARHRRERLREYLRFPTSLRHRRVARHAQRHISRRGWDSGSAPGRGAALRTLALSRAEAPRYGKRPRPHRPGDPMQLRFPVAWVPHVSWFAERGTSGTTARTEEKWENGGTDLRGESAQAGPTGMSSAFGHGEGSSKGACSSNRCLLIHSTGFEILLMGVAGTSSWTLGFAVKRERGGTGPGHAGYRGGRGEVPCREDRGTMWESEGTGTGKWGYWEGRSRPVRTGGEH